MVWFDLSLPFPSFRQLTLNILSPDFRTPLTDAGLGLLSADIASSWLPGDAAEITVALPKNFRLCNLPL